VHVSSRAKSRELAAISELPVVLFEFAIFTHDGATARADACEALTLVVVQNTVLTAVAAGPEESSLQTALPDLTIDSLYRMEASHSASDIATHRPNLGPRIGDSVQSSAEHQDVTDSQVARQRSTSLAHTAVPRSAGGSVANDRFGDACEE